MQLLFASTFRCTADMPNTKTAEDPENIYTIKSLSNKMQYN